jgi:hypothetical protein
MHRKWPLLALAVAALATLLFVSFVGPKPTRSFLGV